MRAPNNAAMTATRMTAARTHSTDLATTLSETSGSSEIKLSFEICESSTIGHPFSPNAKADVRLQRSTNHQNPRMHRCIDRSVRDAESDRGQTGDGRSELPFAVQPQRNGGRNGEESKEERHHRDDGDDGARRIVDEFQEVGDHAKIDALVESP